MTGGGCKHGWDCLALSEGPDDPSACLLQPALLDSMGLLVLRYASARTVAHATLCMEPAPAQLATMAPAASKVRAGRGLCVAFGPPRVGKAKVSSDRQVQGFTAGA